MELVESDVEEADEEADMGEAPPTGNLAPEQVLAPQAILPAVPGFWAGGPSD